MVDARVHRRLAAILAADVVGFSRLMGTDEEGTLAALKASHRDLIDPKVAEHRGRVVNTPGDSVLVEFASAVEATQCAVEIQKEMAERNTVFPKIAGSNFVSASMLATSSSITKAIFTETASTLPLE
jgi:adenylate cyclase